MPRHALDSGIRGRRAGGTRWHLPETAALGANGTQSVATAQHTYWWPCFTPVPIKITALGTYLWTPESGASLRCGLYLPDDDVAPGALLQDNLATLDGSGTAGQRTVTGLSSTTIPTGWWFLAVWASNHSTVRWNRITSTGDLHRMSPVGTGIATGPQGIGAAYARTTATDYSAGLPSVATHEYGDPVQWSVASNIPLPYYQFTRTV